jgi:hypothetical protein
MAHHFERWGSELAAALERRPKSLDMTLLDAYIAGEDEAEAQTKWEADIRRWQREFLALGSPPWDPLGRQEMGAYSTRVPSLRTRVTLPSLFDRVRMGGSIVFRQITRHTEELVEEMIGWVDEAYRKPLDGSECCARSAGGGLMGRSRLLTTEDSVVALLCLYAGQVKANYLANVSLGVSTPTLAAHMKHMKRCLLGCPEMLEFAPSPLGALPGSADLLRHAAMNASGLFVPDRLQIPATLDASFGYLGEVEGALEHAILTSGHRKCCCLVFAFLSSPTQYILAASPPMPGVYILGEGVCTICVTSYRIDS